MQRDYSTSVLYLAVNLLLCIMIGVSWKRLLSVLVFLPVPAAGLLLSEKYRLLRVVSFLFPSLDHQGINYQMSNSLKAIGSGGLLGKGIGQGIYKLGRLPEVHNDFIISNIGEETGLIGIAFVCFLFLCYAYFGLKASSREADNENLFFSRFLLGVTLMVVFQALVNLMVCTGLLPPTGIPLPFFSQGGTNLLIVIFESSFILKGLRETEGAL
jgi:cell division protein FtsW